MKKYIFLLLCLFIFSAANAQNFQWTKQAGGPSYDQITAMKSDDNGNVYVTGGFQLSATFGNQTISSAGGQDIFVAKYNKDGKLLWLKKAGSVGWDYAQNLVIDSKGNVYITGFVPLTAFFGSGIIAKDAQFFLAKYDSSGNTKWVKSLANNYYFNYYYYNNSQSLTINKKDELYFTGNYAGDSLRFGGIKLPSTYTSTGWHYGHFIAKIDTAGKVNWAKKIANKSYYSSNYFESGITTDNNGDIYVSGSYYGDMEIGKYKFSSSFNKKYPNGSYMYFGSGFYIARLDADGNLKWAVNNSAKNQIGFYYNGSGYYYTYGVRLKVDGNKNIYIAGAFSDTVIFGRQLISAGGTDAFITKIDSSGNFKWTKQSGGPFDDIVTDISFKNDAEICAVGSYFYQANFDNVSLTNDNGSNCFIALYDTAGTLKNIKEPYAAQGTSHAAFITKDITGNFYVGGIFLGKIAFNQDTLFAESYEDMFISKFGVCNVPPTLKSSSATNICYGDSVVLSVGNFYNNYRWYNSGTEIKGAKSNKIIAKQSGTYRVVIDSGECSGVSNPITINVGKPANLGADKTLCLGGSVILNPGEFASYLWNDGSSGKTLFVNKSGKYYVNTTNTMGCVSTDTVIITVNTPPKPEIVASPKNTMCPGDTITLRLTLPYANYQWYSNGQIMYGLTGNKIKVANTGNYSVRVSNTDGCENTDTISIKFTQLNQPDIFASGPVSFCDGEEVMLGVSAGYTKYKWLKDDKIIPTQTDNFFKAREKGKYTVLLDSNGCQTTSKPVYVNVYPKPEINLQDSILICNGATVDLDAGKGFTSYKWNTGDTTQMLSVNTSGVYIVSVKNAFGCTKTDSIKVDIRKPLANIILRNDTLFASPALQYQWYFEGTLINGATKNHYVPLFDGNYTVTIWDELGCTNQSDSQYYESKKWKNGEPLELKIYPNPTTDKLTVQFYFGPNVETDVFIELHDALGKKLLEKQAHFNSNFSQKINIDLSDISDGIYLMNIRLNDLSTVKKIIKVRNK